MLRRPGVWLAMLRKEGCFRLADRSTSSLTYGGSGPTTPFVVPPYVKLDVERRVREPSAPQVVT
jgi:hypothetical protein